MNVLKEKYLMNKYKQWILLTPPFPFFFPSVTGSIGQKQIRGSAEKENPSVQLADVT